MHGCLCEAWQWFTGQECGMTPMACVFGACIHLLDSLGSAYDLLVVHLYKLGVRPFPVRKEVDMKTKTIRPTKN